MRLLRVRQDSLIKLIRDLAHLDADGGVGDDLEVESVKFRDGAGGPQAGIFRKLPDIAHGRAQAARGEGE